MKNKKGFSISRVFLAIAHNGRVLGEEALTDYSIELQIFKISTNVK
jgi:hypothetical protein